MEVNQIPVPGEVELFEEAELRIFNGGEGLLDFGSALILRMSNNTELGGVDAETDPDSSRMVCLCLKFGGSIGRLNQPGREVVFDITNGARITVFGSDFLWCKIQVRVVNADGYASMLIGC